MKKLTVQLVFYFLIAIPYYGFTAQIKSGFLTLGPLEVINFKPVTYHKSYPRIYGKLDTTFWEFYIWYESEVFKHSNKYWKFDDIKMDLRESLRKLSILENFVSGEISKNYFHAVNKSISEQKYNAREINPDSNLASIPTPSQVLHLAKKDILINGSWEWKFQLLSRYILVVEPIDFEIKFVQPGRLTYRAYYYDCKIVDDIKNNYSGSNPTTFVANYVKDYQMDIGNRYLILVDSRSSFEDFHGEHYLIRGNATDEYAIFPVEENIIIDKYNKLRQGEKVPLNQFKERINRLRYHEQNSTTK